MHTKDALAIGISSQKIFSLDAWEDSPFFSEKEKVALEWAEKNTKIHSSSISDKLYNNMNEHFSDEALLDLTIVITTINSWNRIAVSFKPKVGSYNPGDFEF